MPIQLAKNTLAFCRVDFPGVKFFAQERMLFRDGWVRGQRYCHWWGYQMAVKKKHRKYCASTFIAPGPCQVQMDDEREFAGKIRKADQRATSFVLAQCNAIGVQKHRRQRSLHLLWCQLAISGHI